MVSIRLLSRHFVLVALTAMLLLSGQVAVPKSTASAQSAAAATAADRSAHNPQAQAQQAAEAAFGEGFVTLERFGGGTSASGAVNAQSLIRAWKHLLTGDGGVIALGPGQYRLESVVVPDATKRITIQGTGGPGGTALIPMAPSDSTEPDGWMLQIGDGTAVQYVTLRDFVVQGRTNDRTKINGIKITKSNASVVDNVYIRDLAGTGLRMERAHNASLNVTTTRCGSYLHGRFAQVYTGDADGDAVANDLRFVGRPTTERDELGIQIAYATNVWSGGFIKLHGSRASRRALEVFRVNNFHLKVAPTLGYAEDGFIYVGDDHGTDQPKWLPPVVPSAAHYSHGTLELAPHSNLRAYGSVEDALVEIDVGGKAARVLLEGLLPAEPRETIAYVRAAKASVVDLQGLVSADTPRMLLGGRPLRRQAATVPPE